MARSVAALVFVAGVAFVGAIVAFGAGSAMSGGVSLTVALLAVLAIPVVVSVAVFRRARDAATALGAWTDRAVVATSIEHVGSAPSASERPPSTWLPGPSANSWTSTSITTSGDLDPAAAEAMVRSLTGLGLGELVRRALAGESIPGVEVDAAHRSFHVGDVTIDTEVTSESSPAAPPLPTPPPAPFESAVPAVLPAEPASPEGAGATRSATAVVHGVRDAGAGTTGRLVELDLLVTISGEQPYRVVTTHDVAPTAIPRRGQTVWVRVDPERPAHVELA